MRYVVTAAEEGAVRNGGQNQGGGNAESAVAPRNGPCINIAAGTSLAPFHLRLVSIHLLLLIMTRVCVDNLHCQPLALTATGLQLTHSFQMSH